MLGGQSATSRQDKGNFEGNNGILLINGPSGSRVFAGKSLALCVMNQPVFRGSDSVCHVVLSLYHQESRLLVLLKVQCWWLCCCLECFWLSHHDQRCPSLSLISFLVQQFKAASQGGKDERIEGDRRPSAFDSYLVFGGIPANNAGNPFIGTLLKKM